MAIVVYKCNTCKRTIEIQRNVKGLDVIGRCVITHGCRGSLFQTKVHPDYIRGSIPDPVLGLDDWKQRKVLHNHTQAIERDEWIIEHNMGVVPTVSVFVDRPIQSNPNNQEEITPTDIIFIDDNNLKLVFDRPWSGTAQLISKQSDPNLLQPLVRTVTQTSAPFQISNLGEISIATRESESAITLNITYETTSGELIVESYIADDQPSVNSAWQDTAYNNIVVNINSVKQNFTVRSFNGITSNMTSGVIDSGSTLKFISVASGSPLTSSAINKGEVIILLATAPYDTVDKVLDRYIDVANITDENNPNGLLYNNGEFFATTETVTTVYPPISNIDS